MTGVDWSRIVERWGTRRELFEHARRAAETPEPRAPETAVEGCPCPRCETYRAGGDREDADVAAWLVERLARNGRPADREGRAASAREAWAEIGCTLPSRAVLTEMAEEVPGAPPPRGEDDEDRGEPLPVEQARRVPIETVVRRLGLGEPTGRWGEPRVLCPFHDDHDPSLRIAPEKGPGGLWRCDPCDVGGDGIRLVEEVLGLEFADAVQWIVDGRTTPTRDPRQRRIEAGRPA